jgi:uncharacterized membrane protein
MTVIALVLLGLVIFLAGIVLSSLAYYRENKDIRAERDELRKRVLAAEMKRMVYEKALEGAVEAYEAVSSDNEKLREDRLRAWGIPNGL